jgi:hypothetical protein
MRDYVEVYTASDITFAYLVRAQLDAAGIPVQIANETVSGAWSIDGMAPGVLVPAAREQQARQIISEMQGPTDATDEQAPVNDNEA